MMMEYELKPCPFCGGEAYDKSAMADHMFRTEEAAVEAWNRRA